MPCQQPGVKRALATAHQPVDDGCHRCESPGTTANQGDREASTTNEAALNPIVHAGPTVSAKAHAQERADDAAAVPRVHAQRHHRQELLRRDQVGEHRRVRGRAHRPAALARRIKTIRHGRRAHTETEGHRQAGGDQRLHHQCGGEDLATVEAVGQQSTHRRRKSLRREGGQGDQSGLDRRSGAGGNEAADDDQLHPRTNVTDHGSTPQQPHRSMA